jgi:hypothetical protein
MSSLTEIKQGDHRGNSQITVSEEGGGMIGVRVSEFDNSVMVKNISMELDIEGLNRMIGDTK